MTPEQIHNDLRALRESIDRSKDSSHEAVEKIHGKITDLQVQVGALKAQNDFANLAFQSMIRTAVSDAITAHEARMLGKLGILENRVNTLETEHLNGLEKRIDTLEHERSQREGMTTAVKVGMAVIQLPGVGAAFYLLGKALGFWPAIP